MSDTASTGIPRRHDLDALRAFAMALGIALHAGLSFTSFPWLVQDLRPNEAFLLFFAAIHGFRMPLFFLVSGFFTMMLWQKRGMNALLKQRFQRVFLPCMIGLATIVPALNWAAIQATRMASAQDARGRPDSASKSELVESVRRRDLAGLERQLADGADPNKGDPEFGVPPLSWAAMYGDVSAARLLLDRGADVNGADKSGYRALHSAAFLGHPDVAELLIQRGADPKARGQYADTARDSTKTDLGMTRMILASLHIPLRDQDELQAGRAECRRLIARHSPGDAEEPEANPGEQGWSWDGVRKGYAAFLSSDRFAVRLNPKAEPFHLVLTSAFHHLWFLWFLCWLVAIFAVLAPLAERFAGGRFPSRLVISPLRWFWVLPLTMIPQSLMGSLMPGFGPDTSAGILPEPHLLLYYAIFFGFGALYYDADDRDGRLGRWWRLTLPLSLLVALPMGLATVGQPWLSGLAQVTYAWAMTFGLIGLFRRFLTRENRTIRYLSDSAYWLYLAHLPLVILMQAWVRDWDWPAIPKFFFICTLATAILLITYQTMVRYTWIGRLLNGPRTRRPPAGESLVEAES
jgi:peptidoglycan/LPS O-acetylase OafA/YrhL